VENKDTKKVTKQQLYNFFKSKCHFTAIFFSYYEKTSDSNFQSYLMVENQTTEMGSNPVYDNFTLQQFFFNYLRNQRVIAI
jgi:hypothetical protein